MSNQSGKELPALQTHSGALIVNADDWGRDRENTDRTWDCIRGGAVSSVSAMVFMEDSERSASLAQEHNIDAGLHLNFTTPFSASSCPTRLADCQNKVAAFLLQNPFAKGMFHPLLTRPFEYVVAAQRDEYQRLYGVVPQRYDGHHHMHLSANVLLGGLLPPGTLVRRHFSHEVGEKAIRNGVFRLWTRVAMAGRYRSVDFLFSLPPLEPRERLTRIVSLSRKSSVEVETHPINPNEYRFLSEGDIFRYTGDRQIAPHYAA